MKLLMNFLNIQRVEEDGIHWVSKYRESYKEGIMNEYNFDKQYGSLKINKCLVDQKIQENSMIVSSTTESIAMEKKVDFYEIEYDSCSMPGVGKYVLKSLKTPEPAKDEVRELFYQMREIARVHKYNTNYTKFYDNRYQSNNALIFYQQGMFMKDFVDDYCEIKGFNEYFPFYQMMGYEQLRTYFTWRGKVRNGEVTDTALSYGFLYIYELLSNIGVENARDGLERLLVFWREFREFHTMLDRYIPRWLKEYHIYYELPHTFQEFIQKNHLDGYFIDLITPQNRMEFLLTLSKYDITKSKFYSGDHVQWVKRCFESVITELDLLCVEKERALDNFIFLPSRKRAEWKPFRDAVFYPWKEQRDRRVIYSEHEIYVCQNNLWTSNTIATFEYGRQLIGYLLKQIEVVLRQLVGYKYKLAINLTTIQQDIMDDFQKVNIFLEHVVRESVGKCYREANKTVVKVDFGALSKIREEALLIQEKLIVFEESDSTILVTQNVTEPVTLDKGFQEMAAENILRKPVSLRSVDSDTDPIWMILKERFTEIELGALALIMYEHGNLKDYGNQYGVMLEVLVDGINEKAMDILGDNLIDETFTLYDDYKEQIKEMML